MTTDGDTPDLQVDELQYFIRLANDCCNENLRELDEQTGFLAAVDSLYMEYLGAAGGVKPAAASILLLNAHASFRAAVRLALSGQLLPVFMTIRGSLESALYANAMVVNPKLQDVWLERDKDETKRRRCRNEFSPRNVFRYLEETHEKSFSEGIREVYESTIDFGAHPNNRSLIRSIGLEELGDGRHSMDFSYIHGTGSFELRQSLVACAEIGIFVFFIALLCFKGHPQFAELHKRALELQDEVPSLVANLGLSVERKPQTKP